MLDRGGWCQTGESSDYRRRRPPSPTGPSYPQGLREVKGPPLLGGPHRVLWASTRTQWNLAAGLEVEDGGRWAPATRA